MLGLKICCKLGQLQSERDMAVQPRVTWDGCCRMAHHGFPARLVLIACFWFRCGIARCKTFTFHICHRAGEGHTAPRCNVVWDSTARN